MCWWQKELLLRIVKTWSWSLFSIFSSNLLCVQGFLGYPWHTKYNKGYVEFLLLVPVSILIHPFVRSSSIWFKFCVKFEYFQKNLNKNLGSMPPIICRCVRWKECRWVRWKEMCVSGGGGGIKTALVSHHLSFHPCSSVSAQQFYFSCSFHQIALKL